MPKISIIIPVYNAQQYLSACIESILSQNFDSFELILVNDGSTDESKSICDSYAKNNNCIKVIHQKNYGASIARINGIKRAKGEYVCFVDSDDDIPRDCIYNMYQKAIDYNADVLVTSINRYINKKLTGTIRGELNGCINTIDYLEAMLRGVVRMGLYAKLFKRTLFDHNYDHYPEGITQNEDLLMNIILLSKVNTVYICNDIVAYNYYLRKNSVSQNLREENYWIRLFDILKGLLIKEFNYVDNIHLQNAFALYQLTIISALVVKQKGVLKEFNIDRLLQQYQRIKDITNSEQIKVLMLKNPRKAKYIRKYYTMMNVISKMIFGVSLK